jgi:periplasmic protein TonB
MSSIALFGPEFDQKPSRRLWILAAVGAVLIHLGGAGFAITHLSGDDADGGLGASAIEIGLELASPQLEPTDLPPGPDTEASVASPALPEQKAEVEKTDLPKDTPTETEQPDRVVTPNESQKPKEEDAKPETVQTTASTESVAAEATARQTVENAPPKEAMVAPNLGIGKDAQPLSAAWKRQLSAYFELHKRYPKDRDGKNASATVSFVLNRLGHVLSVEIAQSSGDPAFDAAAIDMVRRSDPVPKPPAQVTDETFSFAVEVKFTDGKRADGKNR